MAMNHIQKEISFCLLITITYLMKITKYMNSLQKCKTNIEILKYSNIQDNIGHFLLNIGRVRTMVL